LEITLHLFIGGWVDIGLDDDLAAFFASLFTLGKQLERSRVEILDYSGLLIDVSESLLDICDSIQIKFHLECFIKGWEGNL